MSRQALSDDAYRFRWQLIDALWGPSGAYITEDRFVGRCPVCAGPLSVSFHGRAPRATLTCHSGCTEAQIGAQLGLKVTA